jgi:uncharacterized protein YggE
MIAVIVTSYALRTAEAQNAGASGPPQIVTMGVGEARISPDRAAVFIGVQTHAATAAAAGADNARRQRAILDTLRSLGLPSEQLSTSNYTVSPQMQYTPNGAAPPRVIGYTVTNTVRADVQRIDDVGLVIDAALAKGANEISNLQFFSSKADSVRRVALAIAVANARADADALARAAGGSVGGVLELSSSENSPEPRVMMEPAPMLMAGSAKLTPIVGGEEHFSANVTAHWLFVNGRDR